MCVLCSAGVCARVGGAKKKVCMLSACAKTEAQHVRCRGATHTMQGCYTHDAGVLHTRCRGATHRMQGCYTHDARVLHT